MKNIKFYKILVLIGVVCFFANGVYAYDKREKRVYYLDCSVSMIGRRNSKNEDKKGEKDEDDIWDSVKLNLKNAIDAVTDETTELLVVPFANNCDFNLSNDLLKCKQVFATKEGKRDLKKYIDEIPTPNWDVQKTMTYHKIPLNDFVTYRIDSTKETYMFLMTDGLDDEKGETFNDMVKKWHQYTGVKDEDDISDVYGIYVMLNSKYNDKTREELIKRTDYFWQFNTANVNINRIKLSTDVVYNIRNEKFVAIKVDGNTQGLTFVLSAKDSNAPFEIKETTIQGDKLIVPILPKENIDVHSLEESKEYTIEVTMSGADDITFLATRKIKLECISKRENSVTVTHTQSAKTQSQSTMDKIKSIIGIDVDRSASFGTVHYHPRLFWSHDNTIPVVDSIYFDFSNDAKLNALVSAEFQFVNNEGEPYSDDVLTIYDGENPLPNNKLRITSNDYVKELKFVFSPEVETGKYQGYFRLVNHNHLHRIDHYFLDHLETNVLTMNKDDLSNQVNIFQWTIHYKKHLNPLLRNILWVWLLSSILYLIYLFFVLCKIANKPKFTKRIPAFQFIVEPRASGKNLTPDYGEFKYYFNENIDYIRYDTSVQYEQKRLVNIYNPFNYKRVVQGNIYIKPLATNIFANSIEFRPVKNGIKVLIDGKDENKLIEKLNENCTIATKYDNGNKYDLIIYGCKLRNN